MYLNEILTWLYKLSDLGRCSLCHNSRGGSSPDHDDPSGALCDEASAECRRGALIRLDDDWEELRFFCETLCLLLTEADSSGTLENELGWKLEKTKASESVIGTFYVV